MTDTPPRTSKTKLLLGGAGALLVVAGIAVAFVLPAEYGIDPTGIGKALGLVEIADSAGSAELARGMKRSGVLTQSDSPLPALAGKSDHWEIELGPYEAIEFKYEIAQGQPVVFAWRASAPLHYDMHAHPFDGGTALTESYSIDTAQQMQGRYVAAFTGIHGWYWQNRTLESVRLTLDASGAITGSRIFDSTGEHERPLSPAA